MSCECNILLRPALILFASGAGAVEGQATAAPAWENILSVLCNGFELIARSVLKAFWEQVFVFLSSRNQPRQWKSIHYHPFIVDFPIKPSICGFPTAIIARG